MSRHLRVPQVSRVLRLKRRRRQRQIRRFTIVGTISLTMGLSTGVAHSMWLDNIPEGVTAQLATAIVAFTVSEGQQSAQASYDSLYHNPDDITDYVLNGIVEWQHDHPAEPLYQQLRIDAVASGAVDINYQLSVNGSLFAKTEIVSGWYSDTDQPGACHNESYEAAVQNDQLLFGHIILAELRLNSIELQRPLLTPMVEPVSNNWRQASHTLCLRFEPLTAYTKIQTTVQATATVINAVSLADPDSVLEPDMILYLDPVVDSDSAGESNLVDQIELLDDSELAEPERAESELPESELPESELAESETTLTQTVTAQSNWVGVFIGYDYTQLLADKTPTVLHFEPRYARPAAVPKASGAASGMATELVRP